MSRRARVPLLAVLLLVPEGILLLAMLFLDMVKLRDTSGEVSDGG